MVELYEYIKKNAGECELVLKRPQMKFFYYAFVRFADILHAEKLIKQIRFPELHGKVCRALPYDKDLLRSHHSEGNIFVKGFGSHWTHRDLHSHFEKYGEIVSCRVSIEESHKSRGFGYVQYRKPENAVHAVQDVSLEPFPNCLINSISLYPLDEWKTNSCRGTRPAIRALSPALQERSRERCHRFSPRQLHPHLHQSFLQELQQSLREEFPSAQIHG